MANKIQVKRSATPLKVPTTSDLDLGEIAINTFDGKMYIKQDVLGVQTIIQVGGGAGSGDVVGPSSATDNAIARYDGTTGKIIQNSAVTINDTADVGGVRSTVYSGSVPATPTAGTMWFDSATNGLNFQQNNITQQIGEEIFVYGKASSAITNGQLVMKTGVVGASGVITFAPTTAGITNDDAIIGIATEDIALNGFGRVTSFGVVHGINTSAFTDGDTLWYNPAAGSGSMTATKPTAPNVKCQVGIVINAGSGGSGSIQVEIIHGTQLGGTDSNVNLSAPSNGQILTYDTSNSYWKNTTLTAGTAISVSTATGGVLTITNTAPDQVVTLTGAGTTTVTGTYPSFTITSNDQYTGTVTSVGGTGTVAGISLSGTVTSSGNLTLGGTFSLPSGQVPGKMIYDTFTATASQTTFTPSATYTSGKIEVYCNGVKMRNGTDVTVTSGTSVVFTTGLAIGSLVDLVYPT